MGPGCLNPSMDPLKRLCPGLALQEVLPDPTVHLGREILRLRNERLAHRVPVLAR